MASTSRYSRYASETRETGANGTTIAPVDLREMRARYVIEQLPLGKLRSDMAHYRNIRALLNEKDPKKREGSLRSFGLPETATNADILNKFQLPLTAHEPDSTAPDQASGFGYWVERIRDEIPKDEAHKRTIDLFDEEVGKAKFALNHGTTEDCPKGGPNPNDEWRKLLWSSAVRFAFAPDDPEKNKQKQSPHFFKQIAESLAMEIYRTNFVARANLSLRGLQSRNPLVRYGEPETWFYHASKEHNTHLKQDIINLDLEMCLLLNDYVDPIFQHELAHHDNSRIYPPCVEEPRKAAEAAKEELKKLSKDGKGIKVSTQAVDLSPEHERLLKAYLEATYKHGLIHRVWNAIEDNMCNQNGTNLVYEKEPPYPYHLDHSMNVAKTLIAGPGSYVRSITQVSDAPRPEDSGQPGDALPKSVWEKRLNDIGHAIDMAYFLRHELAENASSGFKEIGVDPRVIKDASAPAASHEEAYASLQKLCEDIAKAQPAPIERSQDNFNTRSLEECERRNGLIENLVQRFVIETLDKAMEEFRQSSLDEQIKNLRAMLEAIRRGENMGQGNGSGGGIPIEIDGIEMPAGPGEAGSKPGQHTPSGKIPESALDVGKPWEEGTRDAASDPRDADAGRSGKTPAPPVPMGAAGMPSSSSTSGPPGTGTPALDKINLGTMETINALRENSNGHWDAACVEIQSQLEEIKKLFPSTTVGLEKKPTGTPFDGGFRMDRLHRPSHREVALRERRGEVVLPTDHLYVRNPKPVPIETPGDLFLMIDCSGSMGSGPESRLAIALKSAALLYDAAERAGFGVYISLWGNQHPTLIASPESNKKDVFARLDTPLHAVLNQSNVPGLHGGTNLEGVMASMFAQLAIPREDLKLKSQRGPVFGLLLSDCEVGTQCEQLHEALNTNVIPGVTLDVGTVASKSGDVRKIMEQVNPGGSYVDVDLSDSKRIAHGMLHWATARLDMAKNQIAAHNGTSNAWNLTQELLQRYAKAALDIFCGQEAHTGIRVGKDTDATIAEVEKVALAQREQVKAGEKGTAGTEAGFMTRLTSSNVGAQR